MPFIGTPIITRVTDRCFRISNVSLDANGTANESGLIRFAESPGNADIKIDAPNWDPYTIDQASVSLVDMVMVTVGAGGTSPASVSCFASKNGTTKDDFAIQVLNLDSLASGLLEIYIQKAA